MKQVRFLNKIVRVSTATGCAVAMASCAELGDGAMGMDGDQPFYDEERDQGLEELGAPLTALATACTFTTVAGVLTATIAVADGETAIIAKRSVDSAILVNGTQCGTATATTIKRILVTGSTGTNVVIVDFMNGTFAPGYGTTTGIQVDLVSGTGDAFKIRGSSAADTFTVGADGGAFNVDLIKDIAILNTDAITISAGAGNDIVSASGGYGTGATYASPITFHGGDGNDTLSGGTAADTISGGAGNDTLRGATDAALDVAADTLNGEAGDDTFDCGNATNGGDVMNGGAGTDTASYALRTTAVTVTVGVTADDGQASELDDVTADVEAVTGGTGDDSLTGDANPNTLTGGAGADTLDGDDGVDTLNGGDGDDTLLAGSSDADADVFNGGAGTDTVSYASRTTALTITIDGTANDGAAETDNVKTDVENVIGGAGNDTITGSALANVLTGGDGDDTLNGGAGDDTFDEEAVDSGSDVFNGGAGTDTVDYSARLLALTVTMDGVAADDGATGEADDVQTDIEGLLGGAGADTITGNDGNNVIDGGAAADVIDGGAGADELFGGDAVDTLTGGAGDDTLDGGVGTDTPLDCGDGDGDIISLGAGETALNCEL